MSNLNNITGDRIVTKQSTRYADNFDLIFRKDEKMTESACTGDCNQGRSCNCKTTEWIKHDGSLQCPVDNEAMVEIETWTPNKFRTKAYVIHWGSVKYYRVVNEKK